ncbi:hypothetical protein K474DRAFT_622744 [Panus rudis PR-1116 ss-1]|nr:hypothetical protein K474DRAFT_622744 [Panus rudis PR-1116 ss-1]
MQTRASDIGRTSAIAMQTPEDRDQRGGDCADSTFPDSGIRNAHIEPGNDAFESSSVQGEGSIQLGSLGYPASDALSERGSQVLHDHPIHNQSISTADTLPSQTTLSQPFNVLNSEPAETAERRQSSRKRKKPRRPDEDESDSHEVNKKAKVSVIIPTQSTIKCDKCIEKSTSCTWPNLDDNGKKTAACNECRSKRRKCTLKGGYIFNTRRRHLSTS